MIKECVILDGKVINIGPWDYRIEAVEVSPAEFDEHGKRIKDAEYEEVTRNPMPEGAVIEDREVEQDADGGWYVVGEIKPPTEKERLQAVEQTLIEMMMEGGM